MHGKKRKCRSTADGWEMRGRERVRERMFGGIENGIREKVGRRRERTRNAEVEKCKRRGRGRT